MDPVPFDDGFVGDQDDVDRSFAAALSFLNAHEAARLSYIFPDGGYAPPSADTQTQQSNVVRTSKFKSRSNNNPLVRPPRFSFHPKKS